MMSRVRFLLAVLLVAAVPLGCSDDFPTPSKPKQAEYLEPTSPENVVHNLIEAYTHKESGGYASLLAPEFTFKLQPKDALRFSLDALSRNLDLAATQGIFTSASVSAIQIVLTHTDAEPAAESGFPPGTMRVRVNPTFLSIGYSGAAWTVDGDIQDLFLRPGNAEAGENPDHWFLAEWRDIPDPSAGGAVGPVSDPVPVDHLSWGWIKMAFLPGT